MNENLAKYEKEAVSLMRSSQIGILSTHSNEFAGYPFGSFTTYASARSRMIYFYFSDLGQHTKNLNNNPKSCFTIFKINDGGDLQNSARLTLMGDLKIVDQDLADCAEQFRISLPESKKYSKMHDFNFYQFSIKQIRWIGGFGQIAWLEPKNWKDFSPDWKIKESDIINHMNEDHKDSIQSTLNGIHGIKDKNAKMIRLTIDGYYVNCVKGLTFIPFSSICNSADEYKSALVKQAKDFRQFKL